MYFLALSQAPPPAVIEIATKRPEPPTPVETLGARHYRGAVTAMYLSDDGLHLAMLTSTHWMVSTREPGESWQEALKRAPRIARIPRTAAPPQALYEALCWADDRSEEHTSELQSLMRSSYAV